MLQERILQQTHTRIHFAIATPPKLMRTLFFQIRGQDLASVKVTQLYLFAQQQTSFITYKFWIIKHAH